MNIVYKQKEIDRVWERKRYHSLRKSERETDRESKRDQRCVLEAKREGVRWDRGGGRATEKEEEEEPLQVWGKKPLDLRFSVWVE